MKNGDICYFKRVKSTSSPKGKFIEFKGHGIGLLLGHVPLFQKDATLEQARCLLGMVGYITFDDVAEFLGQEKLDECIKKFEAKYYKPASACPEHPQWDKDCAKCNPAPEAETPAPSNLIGLDGKPLN